MHDEGVTKGRTTFARATREYDPEFERTIAAAVSTAIAQVSLVTDANAMVLRTGEIIAALTTVLASTIALSPAITRSPTQVREFLAENAKRLQRQTMQAVDRPKHETLSRKLVQRQRCCGARMTAPRRRLPNRRVSREPSVPEARHAVHRDGFAVWRAERSPKSF